MDFIRDNKTIEIICNYLRQGMNKKDAASMGGISEATFYRWIEEDENFESLVEASILEYKHTLINIVNKSLAKDGRLAWEVLRKRFPDADRPLDKSEEDERSMKRIAESLDAVIALPDKDESLPEQFS